MIRTNVGDQRKKVQIQVERAALECAAARLPVARSSDASEIRRIIDATRVTIAVGRGNGLGKIETVIWSIKKLRRRFAEPSVDTDVPFAQYQKLAKIAKDRENPKNKEAADRILTMKRSAGNWTAARYAAGSRKVADVRAKTMVVLDIDHANSDQVFDIRQGLTRASEFAWLAHTSRSHYPEKPKFRMAFPVSREMTVDESHAIHRLLSTYLLDDPQESIEIVDLVSFRTNQTMFFPSISQGQDFWTDANDGAILDVDDFLARHPGWEDFTTLPYRDDEKVQGLKDPTRRMEDPREKVNPIGAFCRVYSVEDAIETFLGDIYLPGTSETEIRFTYAGGGGMNGAVVYDDGLFLHSNHGSDPIDGSANAFDLVRIHKFGHLDEKSHENTGPANLPSFKAMVELCRADPDVVAEEYATWDDTLDDLDDEENEGEKDQDEDSKGSADSADDEAGSGRKGSLGDQLDDLPEDDPEVAALLGEDVPPKPEKPKSDKKWLAKLRRKANGDVEPQAAYNIDLICKNHPVLAARNGYNEFTMDPICLKPIRSKKIALPQPLVVRKEHNGGTKWAEENDHAIKLLCSSPLTDGGFEADFSRDNIQIGVISAALQNKVHPVRDMLQDWHRQWIAAGSPRGELDSLAIDYLGCPDTVFHRESARAFLVGAVARIAEPGCKMDVMTIIQGPTGSRKSTFWQDLFNGYCTELKVELNDTGRLIEAMRGWWCLEMAEMVQAKRADSQTLKRELSSVGDQHRLAYARRETFWWRRNVFTGTSNDDDFLTDPTSNRRYFVWVTTKTRSHPIDTERLKRRLWAIWGEAYQAYLDMRTAQPHGDLWLDLKTPEAIAEQHIINEGHRKRTAVEEIAEAIEEWLDTPVPADETTDPSGLSLDEYLGDDTPMIRNMVTAKQAFEALAETKRLSPYRNADVRTYGKAMGKVPGWRDLGRVRRHDQPKQVWFTRTDRDELWVPAPNAADSEIDDLLS
jgi:putative DNA primase/helicase